MESFFVRYRNLLVLLALLAAQIVGLAMQVHQSDTGQMSLDPRDSGGVRLIRLWAYAVVAPPERLMHACGAGLSGLWTNYIDLRNARTQNQELQQTIDRLRLEQAALLEDARQGQRLQELLGFQEKYIYKTVAAQVIGTSGNEQSHVLVIDKGRNAGLEHDMAVITADGIVGKVRDVFPYSAQILLINDQTSGAGVILESTRVRGVLRGNAAGQPVIVGLIADSRIQPGERVLTAGGDEIFPRGLPVGVVDKVVRDPDQDGFIRVLVKPAAHLNRLDEVLVITSTQPRFPPDQSADMATSEAEKGAEVEQQLDEAQKKAAEIMAERLPGLLEPNVPADQQPLNDSSNPTPVAHPPMPLHPDRFTPGTTDQNGLPVPGAQTAPATNDNSAPAKPADSNGNPPPQRER
ncbi:MAG TPA: rod shape-determining protein MreC [Terracidiphilus sp.]|nr:rod shape-determining protein MreC [Terracidiphilus sp.]